VPLTLVLTLIFGCKNYLLFHYLLREYRVGLSRLSILVVNAIGNFYQCVEKIAAERFGSEDFKGFVSVGWYTFQLSSLRIAGIS
jgi:hypothetical protein